MLSNIFCPPPPFLLRIDIVYSMQYSFSPPIHCFEINAEKKGFFPCFVIGSYTCLFIYFTLTKQFFVYLIFFFFLEQQCLVHLLFDPGARKKKTKFLQIAAKMRSCLAPFFFLFLFIYLLILYTYIYISFSSTRSEFLIIPAYILTGSSLSKSVFLSRDC